MLSLLSKYTRRKANHDYYAPCHYHIILRKAANHPFFGSLIGDADIPTGQPGSPDIAYNKPGKIICGNIYILDKKFPALKVYQYKVMPDHVHIFLWVKEKTDKHLGNYIALLKGDIAKEFSRYYKREISGNEIFEENYTDKIIYLTRDFNVIYDYIRQNPYRLAVRFQKPEFFVRKEVFEFNGQRFEAYGNQFLMENPFKQAVIVHRRDSEREREENRERWLEHVAEGGVLVSPFIAPGEKQIRDLAMQMGGRIIAIFDKPFNERFKPARSFFEYCKQGKLLIIAPMESFGKVLTRQTSLLLNELAIESASGNLGSPSR